MMGRKNVLFISFVLAAVIISYFAFRNSDEWVENNQARIEVYNKNYPNLNADERVMDLLEKTNYAAIVYPKAIYIYPNSWFHQTILGNPTEGTSFTIKADVELTIIGSVYKTITYASSSNNLPQHPLFVALCFSEEVGLYAPDNGYEIPATKEIIKFLKSMDKQKIVHKSSITCPT